MDDKLDSLPTFCMLKGNMEKFCWLQFRLAKHSYVTIEAAVLLTQSKLPAIVQHKFTRNPMTEVALFQINPSKSELISHSVLRSNKKEEKILCMCNE